MRLRACRNGKPKRAESFVVDVDSGPSWSRDRRLWILLGGTVAALVLAALVKAPCLYQRWDGEQYEALCYNDLQPLYTSRSLHQHVVPYIGAEGVNRDGTPKGFLEYPVLTGLVLYLAALPSTSDETFFVWNAILLSGFALGTTLVLFRSVRDPRRVAFFAAGPPLVLYAFHNWDLIAVFFATLGLHAFTRGRWILSGVSLGLGAAAKIYPAFFVPILGLALLRDEHPKFDRSVRLVGAAAGTFVALNLPFLAMNPSLWWETYAFHLRRGATYESPWYAIAEYVRRTDLAQLSFSDARLLQAVIAVPLFLAVLAWLGWRVWTRRMPPIVACLGVLLMFLLINKVWSVQYTLWILPFFALMPLDWKRFASLEAADVAVYVTVFPFLQNIDLPGERTFYDRLAVAVAARTAIIVWLLVGTLRRRSPSSLSTTAARPSPTKKTAPL